MFRRLRSRTLCADLHTDLLDVSRVCPQYSHDCPRNASWGLTTDEILSAIEEVAGCRLTDDAK